MFEKNDNYARTSTVGIYASQLIQNAKIIKCTTKVSLRLITINYGNI